MGKMFFVAFILFLVFQAHCQTIDNGWKGVTPLKATRADVEKVWGKGERDRTGSFRYSTSDAFVRIHYSSEPCQPDETGRQPFNVPKDTVLDYIVFPNKLLYLSELKLKAGDFFKDTSGDVRNSYVYVNRDNSIIVSIHVENNVEYVSKIQFRPTRDRAENFRCLKS